MLPLLFRPALQGERTEDVDGATTPIAEPSTITARREVEPSVVGRRGVRVDERDAAKGSCNRPLSMAVLLLLLWCPVFVLPVRARSPREATMTPGKDWWAIQRGHVRSDCIRPVSYTHLTLPTIYSV